MISDFFAYARERHAVYLRRAAGLPRPWTDDPIIQTTPFCNVFRELDKTTVWFRKHVRDPLRDQPEVLLATVIFRWFNRISTGEALFSQADIEAPSAFHLFLRDGDVGHLRKAILAHCGRGPYVTGAYTINTISAGLGHDKLTGVLILIQKWIEVNPDWPTFARDLMEAPGKFTLQGFCGAIRSPCHGPFMTYEVACDLRHTALLERAPDIETWANLGPGAQRGLNRIFNPNSPVNKTIRPEEALAMMRELLGMSRHPDYWPQEGGALPDRWARIGPWPRWEMREVEHTLCEFDKYQRVKEGSGRPRGSFRGA